MPALVVAHAHTYTYTYTYTRTTNAHARTQARTTTTDEQHISNEAGKIDSHAIVHLPHRAADSGALRADPPESTSARQDSRPACALRWRHDKTKQNKTKPNTHHGPWRTQQTHTCARACTHTHNNAVRIRIQRAVWNKRKRTRHCEQTAQRACVVWVVDAQFLKKSECFSLSLSLVWCGLLITSLFVSCCLLVVLLAACRVRHADVDQLR